MSILEVTMVFYPSIRSLRNETSVLKLSLIYEYTSNLTLSLHPHRWPTRVTKNPVFHPSSVHPNARSWRRDAFLVYRGVLSDVVTALETSLLHDSLVPSSPRQGSSASATLRVRTIHAPRFFLACTHAFAYTLVNAPAARPVPYELQTNTHVNRRQRYNRSLSYFVNPCLDSPPSCHLFGLWRLTSTEIGEKVNERSAGKWMRDRRKKGKE